MYIEREIYTYVCNTYIYIYIYMYAYILYNLQYSISTYSTLYTHVIYNV